MFVDVENECILNAIWLCYGYFILFFKLEDRNIFFINWVLNIVRMIYLDKLIIQYRLESLQKGMVEKKTDLTRQYDGLLCIYQQFLLIENVHFVKLIFIRLDFNQKLCLKSVKFWWFILDLIYRKFVQKAESTNLSIYI